MENNLTEEEILRKVSETLTDQGEPLEVAIKPINKIHAFLIARGWMKQSHHFNLTPITVGNMYRIAAKALSIQEGLFDNGVTPGLMNGVFNHTDALVYIVGVAIHNGKSEPPASLLKVIREDFTGKHMNKAINETLLKMDVEAFINTIAWIKGVEALKTKASPAK